jgi:hypothetical protein
MTHQSKKFNTWALRGDTDADWYESYANRTIFELCDAAYILADVQPEYPGSLNTACNAAISQWIDTLKANIHELLAPYGYNEKEPLHHRLSHQKLRAWCVDTGTPWPIPESASDRIKVLEQQLEDERKLRLKAQHLADPVMSLLVPADTIPSPTTLQLGEPEEVYRHLDYLTADQALDWMERISGHHVEWHTLWAMVGFEMCDAFMDCRAVRGLTYAAEGEHEHRKVFGLGICQIMNAVKGKDDPLHLLGAAIHVDMYGLEEIVPKRRWWINDLEDDEVLFRPSDIERMGQIVDERGGWSNAGIPMESHRDDVTDYSGADLVQLLNNLAIDIDNQSDGGLRYSIKFNDGKTLAVLGSDLKPASMTVAQASNDQIDQCVSNNSLMHKTEIAQLQGIIKSQSEQLETLQRTEEPGQDQTTGGITFPYSTKGLEALRTVALKHWADYTPDKRQPTQKDIGYAICEEFGLNYQKGNEPPRKAKELATIIRPDDLPAL